MGLKYKDPVTGQFKDISVKVADSLPIGTEVDYDGETVPTGWEEVDSPNEYSTEETKIGTWIDGKPLYRKVIQTTTPTCSTNGTSAWQQVVIQNVDFGMVKDCHTVHDVNNGIWVTPITRFTLATGLNQYISASFTVNSSNHNGIFQIESSTTAFNNRTVYAVIEYTKVTD